MTSTPTTTVPAPDSIADSRGIREKASAKFPNILEEVKRSEEEKTEGKDAASGTVSGEERTINTSNYT